MTQLKQVQNSIRQQWEKLISSDRMPLFEIDLGNDDYLIVDLQLTADNKAIQFSFDHDAGKTFFSGNVIKADNGYQVLIDEYTDSLSVYLDQVYQEVTEGYLLPNDLFNL